MTVETLAVTISGEVLVVQIGNVAAPGGGGSAAWGGITGTLSAQTDLANALGAKLDDLAAGTEAEIVGVNAAGTVLQRLGYTVSTLLAAAYARASHTGTQLASTISDFASAALAAVTWSTLTGKPSVFPPDTHAHAAADITSGTLVHERGGLEADVSAYSGLVKITGGTTSEVTVTAAGEALLDDASAADQRNTLGLGGAAVLSVGTTASTVAAGDDSRITGAVQTGAVTTSGLTMATARLLGRTTASTGAVEEISVGSGLSLSGGALTGTGSGTATFAVFTPADNQPPASSFATLDTRNSVLVLDFDAAADESAIFAGVVPEGADLTSGIIARIVWMATSATSGNVRWRVAFERRTTDQDSDSFDTATEATDATNGTSGICETCEITCTTIDSIVAGDSFRVRVTRVGTDGTNDTMSGDAELVSLELRAA